MWSSLSTAPTARRTVKEARERSVTVGIPSVRSFPLQAKSHLVIVYGMIVTEKNKCNARAVLSWSTSSRASLSIPEAKAILEARRARKVWSPRPGLCSVERVPTSSWVTWNRSDNNLTR